MTRRGRSRFQGDSAQIQRLIGQINQAQSQISQIQSRIGQTYGRLETRQRQLGNTWGSTRWNGPERNSAENACRAVMSYLGRCRGGVGQARSYVGRINSPLEGAESALRRFQNRLS